MDRNKSYLILSYTTAVLEVIEHTSTHIPCKDRYHTNNFRKEPSNHAVICLIDNSKLSDEEFNHLNSLMGESVHHFLSLNKDTRDYPMNDPEALKLILSILDNSNKIEWKAEINFNNFVYGKAE